VRRHKYKLAGLLILMIGIATWLQPARTSPPSDPAMGLESRAQVPVPVLSVLRRACFDCHSNDTRWPWYSHVAPSSWLVTHDVNEARGQMNFSRWGKYDPFDRADMLDKMCDMVTKGRMPLWQYRLLHHDARLSDADVTALCEWSDAEATRLENGGT
jgi:hypothetical protein